MHLGVIVIRFWITPDRGLPPIIENFKGQNETPYNLKIETENHVFQPANEQQNVTA